MNREIEELTNSLKEPLNVNHFLEDMAPRTPNRYKNAPSNASLAAVLIGLYNKPNSDDTFFSLIKRRVVKGDRHSGQISLPGGRFDDSDPDLAFCALRENEEEIGIDRNQVKILGRLSDMYVYASNFVVSPFVGYIHGPISTTPEPKEVSRIIEVSMKHIVDPDTRKVTDMVLKEGKLKNAPYYDIDNEIVWGATAMILSEFLIHWKKSL